MARPKEVDVITPSNQTLLDNAVASVGDARRNTDGIKLSLAMIQASQTVKRAIKGVPGDSESPINGPLCMFFKSVESRELLVEVDMGPREQIQFKVEEKAIENQYLAELLSRNGVAPYNVVEAINQQVEVRAQNILEYATIPENG